MIVLLLQTNTITVSIQAIALQIARAVHALHVPYCPEGMKLILTVSNHFLAIINCVHLHLPHLLTECCANRVFIRCWRSPLYHLCYYK